MTTMNRTSTKPLLDDPADEQRRSHIAFWKWLWSGSGGGEPGYRRIFNKWGIFHVVIGFSLGFIVPKTLDIAAATILLPLAGVYVGLSFAWAGNAQTLLQSDEITLIAKSVKGGLREYVFTYQLAILSMLVTLLLWGIAGLGLFEKFLLAQHHPDIYRAAASLIYALSSLSLRECWHVVLFAQAMLLARSDVREAQTSRTAPP